MISTVLAETVIVAADATPTEFAEDGTPIGSPGFLGFVVTFILGIFIILLMLDMSRRARRMRYRNEYAMAREAQERAEAQRAAEASPTGDDVPRPDTAEQGVAEHIRRAH